MIFSFIRYTQPGWHFNLKPKNKEAYSSCLYHPEYLPLKETTLESDPAFETVAAKNADIGYRAWNKGELIWSNDKTEQKIRSSGAPSLRDEYTFVFKYWGKPWALFALFQRLISFKNPFREIKSFAAASSTKRTNPFLAPIDRSEYDNFSSPLIAAQPLVTVIIPTLNRYQYLKDVLEDLEKQEYTNFNVIVVDQSNPFNEDFYKRYKLKLQVIHQKEMLLWTARNNAVKSTEAEYLLFFDDDSRVKPDWISQHLKCLDYFNCEISAGVSLTTVGMKVPQSYSYFRWADQFDSGNAMVKREVFDKIGMFDLNFNKQSMGDGEFGIRAYLNGIKSMSNPFAERVHLKVSAGGLREIGHWDGFRPKKWFAPKPIPSVVYLYKKYYPKHLYRGSILLGVMLSNVGFKNKRKNKMLLLSMLLTLIKAPLLLLQFMKSRKKALAMLSKGDAIEYLR